MSRQTWTKADCDAVREAFANPDRGSLRRVAARLGRSVVSVQNCAYIKLGLRRRAASVDAVQVEQDAIASAYRAWRGVA